MKIAAKLAEDGVSPDELARAKAPRIEALQKAQLTNGYWLGELSGAQTDPRRLDVIRQLITGTERITAADVQRAAQTWFRPGRDYRVEIKPAAKVNGAPAAPTPPQTPRAD
jgi:zinc protease